MMKRTSRRAAWFLPLALMLPLVGAAAVAFVIWGQKIQDIISIAIKMAVIS